MVLAATAFGERCRVRAGADGHGAARTARPAPVFNYAEAVRERVFIPVAGLDTDSDGVTDRVAIDIVRPKESGPAVKVPAIIDPSPYYTSSGRGNEAQRIITGASGTLDRFPLFYDNYFVPRGYAFIAAHDVGTAFSTGCPVHGGPNDIAGFKAVIDWLNGRVEGFNAQTDGANVVADWHNGKSAHDRQVLRRHVRQRRRRDRRRGPGHDRPDLAPFPLGTTTRAPAASATTRTTRAGSRARSPVSRATSACSRRARPTRPAGGHAPGPVRAHTDAAGPAGR